MSRERIFYLDFIRAIAAISIVITHYNAIFLYMNPPMENCYIIDAYVFNVYIGSFGVSLFLIISGAALMYVYDETLKLKEFYKKRFFSIYPMFWLAFLAAFFYVYIYCGSWKYTEVPKCNLLLSVIGMDGYLADIVPTFYLVGEWFLGFIVIFYIIFPLLRYLIKKCPVVLAVVSLIIYCLLIWRYQMVIASSKNIPLRLPELLFGMYFIKYIKKSNIIMAVAGLAVLVANHIIKPQWSQDIQTVYIGIASFVFLVYISQFIKSDKILLTCRWISKYSYAIFLTHHIIIYLLMSRFNLTVMTRSQSYLVFFGMCFVIAIASVVLFKTDAIIRKAVSGVFRMFLDNNNVKEIG